MLNTYGSADKCLSLSTQSRTRSPRSFCSRLSLFYLWEQSGKRERRGRYSFLNHQRLSCMICFPLEGTLMILSPNDICLRPIRMAHPDNVSTGIMSSWISSAPVRWAADKFWKVRQVGLHHKAWLHVWSHAKWIKCGFLVHFRTAETQLSEGCRLPTPSNILFEKNLHFGFDRIHPWLRKTLQHVFLPASLLFSFHM